MKIAAIFSADTDGAYVRLFGSREVYYVGKFYTQRFRHTGFLGEVRFPREEDRGSDLTINEVVLVICGCTEQSSDHLVKVAAARVMKVPVDQISLTQIPTENYAKYFDVNY